MAKRINIALKAALKYGKLGWRVFPILAVTREGGCECEMGADCSKPGKHPAVQKWNKVATTSKAQIAEWWEARPDWGVGIATGEESGITVLDVDGDEGAETLGNLAGGEGVPITPMSSSRPGRFHYYFRYNPEIKSNSNKIGPKLDTRGDNGYVVAPPSQHASGSVYEWISDPGSVDLVDWPEWLVEGGGRGKKKDEAKKRGRPAREPFDRANPKDLAKLKSALEYVDVDSEERWGMVGWIMGRAFKQSDEGFALYSAWAARSRKYDKKRTHGHYYVRSKEIRGGDLKTTGSIYQWAREDGWIEGLGDDAEDEFRELHVFENPLRESKMVREFGVVAEAADGIYSQGMRLIHVVTYGGRSSADKELGIDRDGTGFVMLDHDTDTLAVQFSEIAAYWSRKADSYVRGQFSRAAIRTFMACREYDGIKPLNAFISHPTIRDDGTLITEKGYDAESRLYLTKKVKGLKINQRMSQKTAKEAMRRLMAPFSEYPWGSNTDRAVFCAALFTTGLRHLFDIAPLFAFSSPKHGSGKTQLAECISRIWYGVTLSKATWTPNPEEMEKRIAAFLLAGDRMVCMDNVTEGHRLEDSTLNKVLTSHMNTFRILGKTERVELRNEATWFATGNQLMLSGDIARRALMCYVDAKVVDPSARAFQIPHLQEYVLKNRVSLMADALSIVTSWIGAKSPAGKKAHREYGSFTKWYGMIRGLLLWVGEADIAYALDIVTEEDTEDNTLDMFANELRGSFPPDGSRLSVMDVLKLFKSHPELRPAFAACFATSVIVEPNHRTISVLLRRCEHKIFVSTNPGHNFTINKVKDRNKNLWVWGVENVDPPKKQRS